MIEMENEQISLQKSDALMSVIVTNTEGPREAYALLCSAIWRLNFELSEEQVNIDQLCEEVGLTLRSIRKITSQ